MEALQRRANLDLYSELATVLACIGESLPAAVETLLRHAQADDGMLPRPGLPSQRRLEATPDPD